MENAITTHAAILWALAKESGHGAELATRIAERTKGEVFIADGSLYPMLDQLIAKGFVRELARDGKLRTFALTSKGNDEARKLVRIFRALAKIVVPAHGQVIKPVGKAQPPPQPPPTRKPEPPPPRPPRPERPVRRQVVIERQASSDPEDHGQVPSGSEDRSPPGDAANAGPSRWTERIDE